MSRRHVQEPRRRGGSLRAVAAEPSHRPIGDPPVDYATPLRGRRELLARVAEAVRAGARLVTLVGTAGAGKTRLAQEVAFRSPHALVAAFCSLEQARSSAEALARFAAALDAGASAVGDDERAVAALGAAMRRHGDGVFLLDDLDALGPGAGPTVAAWMALAPRARFLVTCRQPLAVRGETILEVPPLQTEDARALFVDRARLGRGDWVPSGPAQRDVDRIVELLDGVPLALELAASRAALLSPREILDRLEHRLDLSRSGSTGRHASLEHAIAISWDALSTAERACLAQCSVFRGGFGVDAAERVVVTEGRDEVIDLLSSLVARSLLHRVPSRGGAERTRLEPYASVRAFAGCRLEQSGRRPEVEARHVRFFVEEGSRWLQGLEGPGVVESRARVLDEQANLLEAFRRAEAQADREALVRIALVASPGLSSFGPPSLHLGILDRAVEAARSLEIGLLARVLALRGWAHLHRGQPRAAESDLAEALVAARQAGDPRLEADALAKTAHLLLRVGRVESAAPLVETALAVARRSGDGRLLGQVVAREGLLKLFRGDPGGAEETFTAALELHERHGDVLWTAFTYSGRGAARMERGAAAAALADFDRALELEERLGDQRIVGVVRVNQGLLRHEQGDLDGAERLLEDGLAMLERVGHRRGEGEALEALGVLALERGTPAVAERRLLAAQDVYARLGHPLGEHRVHAILGASAAIAGRAKEAAEHLRLARDGLAATAEGRPERALVALYEAIAALPSGRARATRSASAVAPGIAHRIAARAFARLRERCGHEAGRPPIAFGLAGEWFQVGGRERVSLGRRGAMKLVLARLVELRLSAPGRVIDVYALFDAGWPGDRARPDVGAARVYEAIRVLRRLGLEDALQHRDGGYRIDPDVAVERAHSKSTR